MSRFTGPLAVTFIGEGRGMCAALHEALVWEVDELGSGTVVTVPKGFVSDGATVPRFLWWLMPPWGDKGCRAAILHDYLLHALRIHATPLVASRRECDRQFYLALRALGVAPWRAKLLYLGVDAYTTCVELLAALRVDL